MYRYEQSSFLDTMKIVPFAIEFNRNFFKHCILFTYETYGEAK